MARCTRIILLTYEVLCNISITVFIPIAIVTFTKLSIVDPYLVIYSFFPIIGLVIVKFLMDLTMANRKEGSCTLILCKMFIKVLVYFSVLLGLFKIQGLMNSVGWGTVVIPLWIVTAVMGSFTVIAFVVMFSKLVSSIIKCKCVVNELLACIWVFQNTGIIVGFTIYMQVHGPRFGDGKASVEVFFPACVALMVLGVGLIIFTAIYHKNV